MSVACTSADLTFDDLQTLVPLSAAATDSGTGLPAIVAAEITCSGSDALGNAASTTFDLAALDTVAPVLTAAAATLTAENLSFTTLEGAVLVDYLATVSATDLGAEVPVSCDVAGDTTNPYAFPVGVTTVSCSATDGTNVTEASFDVTVSFAYGIQIVPLRGRVNAGSTVPLDWRYVSRETGQPIDSASLKPTIRWSGPFSGGGCSGGNAGTGDGADAGSSNFRATSTWQYSWQTPALVGGYVVTIAPPGYVSASLCVTLR